MRRRFWLPVLLLLAATPAAAAEPKCPLELSVCLNQYEKMKHRPWLGVSVERDSVTGDVVVHDVRPDGPARRAGLKAGDVLESIEGMPAPEWFATKAGWKTGDHGAVAIRRDGHEKRLDLPYQAIPEEVFARIVGTHMIEGHLAYMNHDETTESSPR
jgi:predicted metalloprotease with PDZ domain